MRGHPIREFFPRLRRPVGWHQIVAASALWIATTTPLSAQEFRAAWADVFHVGMGSQTEVNNMVSALVAGRYNAVVVQVLAYMDNSPASHGAHWKSAIVPWSSRVTAGFDPLAYLCQQAHANGIEVHAWLGGSGGSMYRVSNTWPPAGNATLTAHPEWFSVPRANSEGGTVVGYLVNSTTYYTLDMGSPDAQEYIVSIVRELVTNYPVDGINWDDEIDGPVYTAGVAFPAHSVASYPNSGLGRFQRNTGYVGTPSATDPAYNNYRRRFKNELMARVQAEIQSIKTNPRQPVRHTSAALAYSPVPTSCDFTTSTPYTYYCDWAGMMQNGWLDAVIPQTYSSSTFNSWADKIASCWQYNRHIYPGIGAYLNVDATIAAAITYTRSKGLKGNCIYSYAVPTSASGSGSGWWAYAAANVYTNIVSTPPMPWRNPATATEGIIWGRVKDANTDQYVDDATVTVTGGPTVKTDGNGYYVATLVPATAGGTPHSTTASKTGSAPQTATPIALAGDIVRHDFLLNSGGPSAPTGLVATAISGSQLALARSDTATNETGFVVARRTISGGSYTDIASLSTNATAYTNTGLAPNTTYYYVVRATNAVGASPDSVQASATTPDVPTPPLITASPQDRTNIVGQPAAFYVAATGSAPLSYQWRCNGTNLVGATTAQLILTDVQINQAGDYGVVVTNAYGKTTNSAILTVHPPFDAGGLKSLWSLAPGERSYLTVAALPGERGLTYNPATRRLILVDRTTPAVYVLNADNGADLWTLNTTGVTGGTYPLLLPGAADDGVLYAGNLTTAGNTTAFKLYRWANDGSATVPSTAYSGNPGPGTNQRWGDTLDVRGAGTNTQIIVASRTGSVVAIFTTADGTNFAPNPVTVADAPAGAFGLGVAFGAGDTFWGKATSQNLRQVSFNLGAGTGTTVRNHGSPDVPSTVAPIGVSTPLNLLGGINVGATSNHFRLYDLAPAIPAFIASTNFLTDNDNTGTGTGAVDFGEDRVFALGANNGLLALQILPAVSPPAISADPQSRVVKVGTNVMFTVAATGTEPLRYQWQFNLTNIAGATNSSFALSPVRWTNGGNYLVIVTNLGGAISSAPALLTVLPADPSLIDSVLLSPDGRVEFTGSGDVGDYTIEVSTNLVNWQDLIVVPNTNGTFLWLDSVTNADQRFYRARHD